MAKGRKVVRTKSFVRGELLNCAYQKALDFVFRSGDATDDPRVYENVGSHIIAIARGGETRFLFLTNGAIARYKNQRARERRLRLH